MSENAPPGPLSARSRASPVAPGDILAGKYRVDRVLGVGGMGVVVQATHIDLLEARAIKFMLPQHVGNAEAVERFLREARACAKLKGEHVAKVHDVGKLENGAPYMIMEYLIGADLSVELDKRGALPVSEAAGYLLEACEAVAEAHAAGIVHRDLKPENLFLARGPGDIPSVKVLDFGISMVLGNEVELRMTNATTVMGSPFYMSPEQTRSSRDVDTRTDIWSLGVILYQLITGRMPFEGTTLTEIVSAVLYAAIPLPSQAVLGLPEGIERVVLRCLERDLDRRYQSVSELAMDLAGFARAGNSSLERISRLLPLRHLRIQVEDSVSGVTGATMRSSQPEALPAAPRPRPPLLNIAVGAAIAIGLGGAAFLYHRSTSHHDVVITQSAQATQGPGPAATQGAPTPPAPPPTVSPSAEAPVPPATASAAGAASAPSAAPTPSAPRPLGGRLPSHKPSAEPPSSSDPFGAGRQ